MRSEGRRVELIPQQGGFQRLRPGEYGVWQDGTWYGCTPNGHGCTLARHSVVEHADGTITVAPSILVTTRINGSPQDVEVWHGFIERGVWRDA